MRCAVRIKSCNVSADSRDHDLAVARKVQDHIELKHKEHRKKVKLFDCMRRF